MRYETKSNSKLKFVVRSHKTAADSLLFESSFQVDSESPKYGYYSACYSMHENVYKHASDDLLQSQIPVEELS